MPRVWYNRPGRAVLVGYAPPGPHLDLCAPLVAEDAGRRIERLAGIGRGSLPHHFGAALLFVRHARSVRLRRNVIRREGSKVLGATVGRVLVALGAEVRDALRLEGRAWCERIELRDHVVYVLPHPSGANRWYNDPENRTRAAAALRAAREEALQYGV